MRADLTNAAWRKSSHSDNGSNACLEVADGIAGVVPVRDSKDTRLPVIPVPAHAWATFIDHLKS
ncbi:DUF397 domain-containing protein [Streptomyces sp. P38-E01]|uniref:DUF397 domain-containing protein n=1 Tax=Streptomyces tardus TaxID=2780544 RepID=A0A949JMN0_9ACTN|nr:DUF397 domain-containing protein [Streptomyces tardus]MBU7597916.1 DUF397 domain-containing protein [Streptomyces tardus]